MKRFGELNPEKTESIYYLLKEAKNIRYDLLSAKTKDKLNAFCDYLYFDAYFDTKKQHNLLYNELKNGFISLLEACGIVNEELQKDGEYCISEEMFCRLYKAIDSMQKESINKETTEKLNYKLF